MTTIATAERREILRQAYDKSQRHKQLRAETRAWLAEPVDTWDSRDRLATLLLGDPSPHLATLPVVELLCWCRGVRHSKARRILRAVGLDHGLKTVGRLTDRQCRHLAGVLRHGYHDQPDLLSRVVA
jgi:hypothetical protein